MKGKWELPYFSLDLSGMGELAADTRAIDALGEAAAALTRRRDAKEVGFFDWPETGAPAQLDAIRKTASFLRKDSQGALCLGIGGSCLGPVSILQALRSLDDERDYPIHWVSNFDPPAAARARAFLARTRAAGLAISKSGGTLETLAALYHLAGHVKGKWAAVTDPEAGELAAIAQREKWSHVPMPRNVGGRFSVLTAVGLLPAALAGIDPAELLEGARETRRALLASSPEQSAAGWLAWCLHACDRNGRGAQVFMPYWSSLSSLSGWFVQLWAESLGKRTRDGKAVGPTPVAALGSTDQHSLLQLLREGPADKVVGFVDVDDASGPAVGSPPFPAGDNRYVCRHPIGAINHHASLSTEESVRRSGTPTWRITLPRLDARGLGGLFLFLETACALAGELYGVNPYDQPGVEEAKRLLHSALQ